MQLGNNCQQTIQKNTLRLGGKRATWNLVAGVDHAAARDKEQEQEQENGGWLARKVHKVEEVRVVQRYRWARATDRKEQLQASATACGAKKEAGWSKRMVAGTVLSGGAGRSAQNLEG